MWQKADVWQKDDEKVSSYQSHEDKLMDHKMSLRVARQLHIMFKESLEQDKKRKCDKIDELMSKFTASPNSLPHPQVLVKHLEDVAGDHVAKDVLAAVQATVDNHKKRKQEKAASSVSTSSTSPNTSSATATSSVTTDQGEDVLCMGERTLAQRNAEGFANAIELEDDEKDDEKVHVLPPKDV